MLLADLVATSASVAATRSRKAKVAALAELLGRVDPEVPDEVEIVVSYLSGALRQRRTGLGWRSLGSLPEPAGEPSLTVLAVDEAFGSIAALAGPGSQAVRAASVAELFAAATGPEQAWLRGAITGEVRQGALDALVQEAVALTTGIGVRVVRRAAMLAGSTVAVARAAITGGGAGLAAFGLEVGRPVSPMLASTAPSMAEALAKLGADGDEATEVAVDTKLDGIRIQVHRDGDDVTVATRTLEDITDRLPEVVEVVRALRARTLVLDGEAIALGPDGRPRPFQETASRTASSHEPGGVAVTPYFFDVLHRDGTDLLDEPTAVRLQALDDLVPPEHRAARLVTAEVTAAEAFARDVLAAGHEGVVVKDLAAPWEAGRRGAAWVKVKPRLTLDLVVLAVEWGSGRRTGRLSNIHLGARDPDAADGPGFVMLGKTLEDHYEPGWIMVGKTFKGLTDEMLAWQTERFLELETHREGHVVYVRPEQVVEIAFDGAQRSSRYPGGVALRFARVVRYRDDKAPDVADTIDSLRSFLGDPSSGS